MGCRTTAHPEGFHSSLNKRVKAAHVNLFDMITHLKRIEHNGKLRKLLREAWNLPPPEQKKYRKINQRLESVTDEFRSGQIALLSYIHKISRQLHELNHTLLQEDSEFVALEAEDNS